MLTVEEGAGLTAEEEAGSTAGEEAGLEDSKISFWAPE